MGSQHERRRVRPVARRVVGAGGGTITYDIRVFNSGTDPAPETTLELDIPEDATLTATSGTIGSCAPLPASGVATVTCQVPALGPDEEASLAADVVMDREGVFQMAARVPTDGDDDPDNNAATEGTTIAAGADIDLSLSGPASAASGDTVTYSFTAENLGPNALDSAVLEFPVPTGFANIAPPANCTLSGGTYLCDIPGPVAVGESVTLDFQGQVAAAAGSTVTPVGSVSDGAPADPITDNNTATFDMEVTAGSDVAMAKSRAPGGEIQVGDEVTFTLSPSYTGSTPNGLTITDTVPSNYQIESVVPAPGSGWVCDMAGQDVTCAKPSGSGAGANVSLGDIAINATAISAGSPANSATITADGPEDPDPANNTGSDGGATITDPVVDLRANKSGPTPALVVVGNTYDFPISTTNVGNAPFFGTVVMTDNLPAGLTYTGATRNGWTCTPPPLTGPAQIVCERVYTEAAPLEPGASTPSAVINAEATAPGTIVNSMTVSSPDANIEDGNPGNDTTTTTVEGSEGNASADISLNKSASLATLQAGDVQTFTLEVVNAGPETSRDIEVTDTFSRLINNNIGATDAGYIAEVVTANAASGVSCSTANAGGFGRRLTCDIAELPVCTAGNDCPVITVQVRPGGDPGARTNTASVISPTTADPNLGNNGDSAGFDIEARTDVTVSKVGSPDPVAAGQELTYVLTASAARGYSRAEAVTVTDTLPDDVTFISASPSTGSCSSQPAVGSTTGAGNNQVVCDLGTIEADAQQTVTIVVRPNTATRNTTLTNTASVATDTPEADTTNNDATSAVEVSDPVLDLLVNKTDSIDPVAVGQDTVYTISVTNRGPSAAENVVVTDDMPASGLAFRSHTIPSDGSCSSVPAVDSVGGQLVCSFPVLPASQSRQIQITARGTAKGTATNNASVASDESGSDTNPGNDTTDERTTVRTRADLAITKTAPGTPVNLRDSFSFTIEVRNLTGGLLAEADDVVVSDTLPGDMVLTGAPVASVTTGSASSLACSGGANDTAFTCDLGTLSSGGIVTIDVPVKLTRVTSYPQDFTNRTSVTTSSLDVNESNNSDTATVTVNSSSLSGNVFRDFNNNGAVDAEDTGIGGVTMTLTGTSADGEPFTETVTTDSSGDFIFPYVPEGTYTITRGDPGEPHLEDGQASAGSGGGSVSGPREITGVTVGANADETDYLFALVPQARIGIVKSVSSGPVPNADGSFDVTFGFAIENPSLERLVNIDLTDSLTDFGNHVPAATDPLAAGDYTVLGSPSDDCGGWNGAFDGTGNDTVASGFDVDAGASCTIEVELRVRPDDPAKTFGNQASVRGDGELSGQTPEDDDTATITPAFAPSIELIKTGTAPATPAAGDEITYTFEVRNTGDVTLTDVRIDDPLLGGVLAGGPITLAPGASDATTFTGTYTLDQDDIDAGEVENTATTTGTDPFGEEVEDSDTATTPMTNEPSIALVKTADASGLSDPAAVGEEIAYSFTVTNTGNLTLSNVTIEDLLPGLTMSGGPIPQLAPDASDSTTFSAVYVLTQDDLDAGQVENTATATGTSPAGDEVSDQSGADNDTDEPTIVPVAQNPEIELVKTAQDEIFETEMAEPGDTLDFTFTVTNTGNVTLTDVTISDALAGVTVDGGPIASLAPGEEDTDTFTATYVLTEADIAAGEVVNTATVTGNYTDGSGEPQTVTDESTDTAVVTSIEALPEVFPPFTEDGGTTTSILESDTLRGGPATLDNVTIRVIEEDDGATLDPETALITLAPGQPAGDYDVTYEICSIEHPAICDQAVETVRQMPRPGIETIKTQELTDNGDGINGVGDIVTYTITVENTGNTPIENLTLTDVFTAMDGTPLTLDTGPDFDSASEGSPEGELQIGETATYMATYELTIEAVSGGGLSNRVVAEGDPVYPPEIDDPQEPVSDDSSDGSGVDGPTELPIDPSLAPTGLTVEKTALRRVVERGSVVPYTITVKNENPVVSGVLNIVDVLPAGFLYQPDSATLDGEPANVEVAGRVVTWTDVPVPPQSTVMLGISARVTTGADPGDHVNKVSLRDPANNALLAPVATATVRIMPEPVFDCGDVIGTVFDDENRDGYQNQGEIGIPAARVVGVDGTIITTDEHGRFHVPCAMLPADRGSNFILKLDTRSLPSGYRVTTENPRVRRLTPGKMSEINFGAAITRVVRVDLNDRAFATDTDGRLGLGRPLAEGIANLLPRIAGEPVNLRLAYHLPAAASADDVQAARARMRLVERHIRKEWRDTGRVKLIIEQTLVRSSQ